MTTRSRGSNFSVAEEQQLCRSYLAIGKDAATGTNQTSGGFWDRIWKDFEKGMGEDAEERTLRSLESKWGVINGEVSKFVAAMAIVKAVPKSGESAEDQIVRATKAYFTLADGAPDGEDDTQQPARKKAKGKKKAAKAFKFLHCWRILETEPKWQTFRDHINGSVEDPATPASTTTAASTAVPTTARPRGVKATKDEDKNSDAMETNYRRLAHATMQIAKSSAKRVQALEDANNLALFSMQIETLDPAGKQYVALLREAALRKLQNGMPNPVDQAEETQVVETDRTEIGASVSDAIEAIIVDHD